MYICVCACVCLCVSVCVVCVILGGLIYVCYQINLHQNGTVFVITGRVLPLIRVALHTFTSCFVGNVKTISQVWLRICHDSWTRNQSGTFYICNLISCLACKNPQNRREHETNYSVNVTAILILLSPLSGPRSICDTQPLHYQSYLSLVWDFGSLTIMWRGLGTANSLFTTAIVCI